MIGLLYLKKNERNIKKKINLLLTGMCKCIYKLIILSYLLIFDIIICLSLPPVLLHCSYLNGCCPNTKWDSDTNKCIGQLNTNMGKLLFFNLKYNARIVIIFSSVFYGRGS